MAPCQYSTYYEQAKQALAGKAKPVGSLGNWNSLHASFYVMSAIIIE